MGAVIFVNEEVDGPGFTSPVLVTEEPLNVQGFDAAPHPGDEGKATAGLMISPGSSFAMFWSGMMGA